MKIIVTREILAEYVEGDLTVKKILDNFDKRGIDFFSIPSAETEVKKTLQILSNETAKEKIDVLGAVSKKIQFITPQAFQITLMTERPIISEKKLVPYLNLYLQTEADYIWIGGKTIPDKIAIKESPLPIVFITTEHLKKEIDLLKREGLILTGAAGVLQAGAGSGIGLPNQAMAGSGWGMPNQKPAGQQNTPLTTYTFLGVDVPIANYPPEVFEYTRPDKSVTRSIKLIQIPQMQFTVDHATEYLENIGIYSYRQNHALFDQDLFFNNWKDIVYVEVQGYQPHIRPDTIIHTHAIPHGIPHLLNLFITPEGKYNKIFGQPRTFEFNVLHPKKVTQEYTTAEQKLKQLGRNTELPFTYEAIVLDKDEFKMNIDALKKWEQEEADLVNEYDSVDEFCENMFDNLINVKTLLDGQRLLRYSNENGVDVLEVTSFRWNLTRNRFKQR